MPAAESSSRLKIRNPVSGGGRKPALKRPARVLAALAVQLSVAAGGCGPREDGTAPPPLDAYAGSSSCRTCHPAEYDAWTSSHHASAERDYDPEADEAAFSPPRTLRGTDRLTRFRLAGPRPLLTFEEGSGAPDEVRAERILGHEPLRQMLVPGRAGRWQATEAAYDPVRGEWFEVFGADERRPGEWGHWTGRGMNWNSQCAACHNTSLRKAYDPVSDGYATVRAEMGVGCEACHGPGAAHAVTGDPPASPEGREAVLATCGSCHSRRSELNGGFIPGARYLDHFSPALPDDARVYAPDGRVLDEAYVYISFLSSGLHRAGVDCLDCHEPHTGRIRDDGNALCLRCHSPAADGRVPAVPIDAAVHSRHAPASPGARCVECHMPETVFMQRDPRRDHGFTIPDPVLARELGLMDACTGCHASMAPKRLTGAFESWYGRTANARGRARARLLAGLRSGSSGAVEALPERLHEEPSAVWRASFTGSLLARSRSPAGRRSIETALRIAARDRQPLVRARAARVLGALTPEDESLRRLLNDPVRLVRVEAAWAFRGSLDAESRAGRDLLAEMAFNADQPAGALRLSVFRRDRADAEGALEAAARAAAWDPGAAPARAELGLCLNLAGRNEEALGALREAVRLAPRDAAMRFNLALLLGEAGLVSEAERQLVAAVELAPDFARAWYNLGLARAGQGRDEPALTALARAEALDPGSADPPFARATILARLGRRAEAADAARRALALDPRHRGAASLLDSLNP